LGRLPAGRGLVGGSTWRLTREACASVEQLALCAHRRLPGAGGPVGVLSRMNGIGIFGRYGGGFLFFVGIPLLIALIVLVVWAVANLGRTGRTATHDASHPTPNEILRERFARGEITAQEFEDAKKVLGPDR
jgi:putative membrane protein